MYSYCSFHKAESEFYIILTTGTNFWYLHTMCEHRVRNVSLKMAITALKFCGLIVKACKEWYNTINALPHAQ